MTARWTVRGATGLLLLAGGVDPVVAHSGTTHGGTPHSLLFASFCCGIAAILGGVWVARRTAATVRGGLALTAVGVAAAVFGGVGLVELQVVGRSPPRLVTLYPLASLVVGWGLAFGGLVVIRWRWPRRPRYVLLPAVLAGWILYPTVMPGRGYRHPLGYALALALPVVIGSLLWTDGRAVLQSLRLDRRPLAVGVVAGVVFDVFFAFSAGTMSLNPDRGAGLEREAFVVPYRVASPLVTWPAVEWYFPSIPFAGYVSVGSLLLMGVLGGLVGLNAAVFVQQ